MGHLDRFQRFGNRSDLVQLNQNGIAAAKGNPFCQTFGVGDKQIVSHQLYPVSQLPGQHLPAFPVLFVQTVLNGINGIFIAEGLPMPHKLRRGKFLSAFGKQILAFSLSLPFAGSRVHSQDKILTRLISRFFHSLEDDLDCFLITGKIRGKTAFVTYGSAEAAVVQHFFQGVEYFGSHAQAFTEGRGAYRPNHKFLESDRSVAV